MSQNVPAGEHDGSSATPEPRPSLSTEQIFETLSNQRRRYVLHYLKGREQPVTVRELSEQIAAWENETTPDAITPKERKRVYTALHQTHLPRMAKTGVVRYDADRSVVELSADASAFDVYLEVTRGDDLNWSDFYLGLAGISLAVSVVVAIGIYPFTLVPTVAYVLLISLVFLGAAAAHAYETRRSQLGGSGPPPELLDD